jgi:hypothetical protein
MRSFLTPSLMDEWTTKTTNPICRLFFKIDLLTDFAALWLKNFMNWRYIQSRLVFSTQLVNCCPHGRRNYTCVLLPLYLLSDLPPPAPTLPKLNVQYMQTVCGCGGGRWGVLNCAVDHILQEFYTLFLTRFRTCKIASPPPTKVTRKDDIYGLVSLKLLRQCPLWYMIYDSTVGYFVPECYHLFFFFKRQTINFYLLYH